MYPPFSVSLAVGGQTIRIPCNSSWTPKQGLHLCDDESTWRKVTRLFMVLEREMVP